MDQFTEIEFGNYGPIQHKTLRLTPLHALIGPNDSGKSTALRGLVAGCSRKMVSGEWNIKGVTRGQFRFQPFLTGFGWGLSTGAPGASELRQWTSLFLRLDPDELRAPHRLLTDGEELGFHNERGRGLGSVLDAIASRSRKDFAAITEQFTKLFPTVDELSMSTTEEGRRVGIKLKNGQRVGPEFMSEGMLYYLAFILLPYLQPTGLVVIEEPENGLHPSRIADVMRVLREVSKTRQIVMATHSPLVVNELQPEEVTLVTRTESEGTKFTPIKETPNFAQRAKTYALGELWLSYADGKTEAPLFKVAGA